MQLFDVLKYPNLTGRQNLTNYFRDTKIGSNSGTRHMLCVQFFSIPIWYYFMVNDDVIVTKIADLHLEKI